MSPAFTRKEALETRVPFTRVLPLVTNFAANDRVLKKRAHHIHRSMRCFSSLALSLTGVALSVSGGLRFEEAKGVSSST